MSLTFTALPGTLYLVQELAPGRDLFWLWWETKGHRLTEDRARFFVAQLIDAVHYLHSVGICHRDLKLQNLLLDTEQRTLKLSDFGTAEPCWGGPVQAAGVGTPCFWPPEVLVEEECDGTKIDTWSCGLMVYQLLAGVTPFEGVDFEAELDAAATDAQRLLSLYGPSRGPFQRLHGCLTLRVRVQSG